MLPFSPIDRADILRVCRFPGLQGGHSAKKSNAPTPCLPSAKPKTNGRRSGCRQTFSLSRQYRSQYSGTIRRERPRRRSRIQKTDNTTDDVRIKLKRLCPQFSVRPSHRRLPTLVCSTTMSPLSPGERTTEESPYQFRKRSKFRHRIRWSGAAF